MDFIVLKFLKTIILGHLYELWLLLDHETALYINIDAKIRNCVLAYDVLKDAVVISF